MHPAYDGLASLPYYDEFDLSTVDVLLISQYVTTCSLFWESHAPLIVLGAEDRIGYRKRMLIRISWCRRAALHTVEDNCLPSLKADILLLLAHAVYSCIPEEINTITITIAVPGPAVHTCDLR